MSYRQPEYPHAELGSFRLASFNAGTLDCIVPYQPDLAQLHGHTHTLRYWTTKRGWIFPKERFTTYGPEDERWCRFFEGEFA